MKLIGVVCVKEMLTGGQPVLAWDLPSRILVPDPREGKDRCLRYSSVSDWCAQTCRGRQRTISFRYGDCPLGLGQELFPVATIALTRQRKFRQSRCEAQQMIQIVPVLAIYSCGFDTGKTLAATSPVLNLWPVSWRPPQLAPRQSVS